MHGMLLNVDIIALVSFIERMFDQFAGNILRAARLMIGVNQSKLAAEVGVDRQTIVRLETRTIHRLTAEDRKVSVYLKRKGLEVVRASSTHGAGVRWREPDREEEGVDCLRGARGLLELSQTELAKLLEIDRSMISRLEKRAVSTIAFPELNRMIELFDARGVEITPATKTHGAGVRWKSKDFGGEHISEAGQ
jgi:DNA-binding XRE family transcriptional regulator